MNFCCYLVYLAESSQPNEVDRNAEQGLDESDHYAPGSSFFTNACFFDYVCEI